MNKNQEECLKLFGVKDKKSVIGLTLEEQEIYKICLDTSDNNVVIVDAEPLSADKLAEIVRYLKNKQLKFVVLS